MVGRLGWRSRTLQHRACRKIEWTTQALIGAWHTIVEPSEEEDISLGVLVRRFL
jgi:hypothetical protein